MEPIRLFCFPPAGMSAMTYNNWRVYLDEAIELYPVELAGRGIRFQENFYQSFEAAVEDVYSLIAEKLAEKPYAFFGHCMGSWIAYELYFRIKASQGNLPRDLFVSGKEPPHIMTDKFIHELPDEDFIQEIMRLGGTSPEIFEDEDMLNMFLPVLRNDFRMVENRKHVQHQGKLECDLSVLYGKEANGAESKFSQWKDYTNHKCDFYEFEGNQFFVHEETEKLTAIINRKLLNKPGVEGVSR